MSVRWVHEMSRQLSIPADEAQVISHLGERFRLARLRRNLSQQQVAERAAVTRKTYADLEAGKPTVSVGVLVKAMSVLGYLERVPELLASDPVGEDLEAVHGRRRAGRHHAVADF